MTASIDAPYRASTPSSPVIQRRGWASRLSLDWKSPPLRTARGGAQPATCRDRVLSRTVCDDSRVAIRRRVFYSFATETWCRQRARDCLTATLRSASENIRCPPRLTATRPLDTRSRPSLAEMGMFDACFGQQGCASRREPQVVHLDLAIRDRHLDLTQGSSGLAGKSVSRAIVLDKRCRTSSARA